MPNLLQYQALAFVAVIAAAPASGVYVQGQQPEPVFAESFQYDDLAEPVFVPTQAEAVTLDKFSVATSLPTFTARRPVQYETVSGRVIDGPPPAWVPQEAYRPAVKRPTFAEGTQPLQPVTAAGAVTSDRWHRPAQEPVRPKTRVTFTTGTVDFLGTLPERASLDKWEPRWPQPRFTTLRARESASAFVRVVTQTETVTVDKWGRSLEVPRRLAARRQEGAFAFVRVSPAESLTLDKWWRETERPQKVEARAEGEPVSPPRQSAPSVSVFTADAQVTRSQRRPVAVDISLPLVTREEVPNAWARETERPLAVKAGGYLTTGAQVLLTAFAPSEPAPASRLLAAVSEFRSVTAEAEGRPLTAESEGRSRAAEGEGRRLRAESEGREF